MILSLVIISFFYGISVGHYHIFPFEDASNFKNFLFPQTQSVPKTQIHQELSEINELISFKNSEDILIKQKILTEYIWPDSGFPTSKLPVDYQVDISDNMSDLQNLKRIDSFTVEMDYGMNSISYLFLANNSNNKLIIYHQGSHHFFLNYSLYNSQQGYSVLSFHLY